MSAPSSLNHNHSSFGLTPRRPLPQPPSPSTPGRASILNKATNTQINNSIFTTNDNSTTTNTYSVSSGESPLALLYNSVAPNAILNSGGRADEVRCHPGTREKVIHLVEKSISRQYDGPQVLWLSGSAGAGKSAIMQTVAERCKKQDVPHANFFFFRADRSRSDARSFVATIMHQIIRRYPSVEPNVAVALKSDPLLFEMGIQQQVDVLLDQALAHIHCASSSLAPLVLLIDGLDECDSETKSGQRQILQALDALHIQKGMYFRVVVASRAEPQISMVFSQLRSKVDSIFLDDKYSPDNDIHSFVTAEFNKIKSTHYLASTLGPEWPSHSDITGIVSKSSGQFIFAATVMRFISHSPASPILSLQKVQGILPPNKTSPFAPMDAIYAYILGQVEDLDSVKVLLAILFLHGGSEYKIADIMTEYHPKFTRPLFNSCVSELAPLARMSRGTLEFYHASFPDFVYDRTRSKEYHIDLEKFCTQAFPIWWKNQSALSLNSASLAIKKIKQPTHEITTALMECNLTLEHFRSSLNIKEFHKDLRRIYAPHDFSTFIKILHVLPFGDPELAHYIHQYLFAYDTTGSKSRIYSTSWTPPGATHKTSVYHQALILLQKSWDYFTGKSE